MKCDSKETKTNHVRSKLSEISKVNLENILPEKISNYRNIGPFKGSDYRYFKLVIRLTISIIDYRTALSEIVKKRRSEWLSRQDASHKCLDQPQILPFFFGLSTTSDPLEYGIHQIRPYMSLY